MKMKETQTARLIRDYVAQNYQGDEALSPPALILEAAADTIDRLTGERDEARDILDVKLNTLIAERDEALNEVRKLLELKRDQLLMERDQLKVGLEQIKRSQDERS